MTDVAFAVLPEFSAALAAASQSSPAAVHRLQVGLARLVLDLAPPAAPQQLELAAAFIEGRAESSALTEARQDCWIYVGSLACGCSLADSASAHAIMTCLEPSPDAHSPQALLEQVERVLRCGVERAQVLQVLQQG
ncbi:MAG TPA: hypothetical protein VEQ58_21445 [Polyangiaceae bacterium]|nr:hypothetical protein [Polyangiaceae bacterium]